MFNIRSVDLNLLPVFEAVYEEKSVSRAAARLAMTQSSVSHAVGRLRILFRDELFVRHSTGVLPTATADRLYGKVRTALSSARDAVEDVRTFDRTTSDRRFFVSDAHPLGPLIALKLLERLARSAPHVEVITSTRSRPIDLDRALRDGRIDMAVDWLDPVGEGFKKSLLFDESLVVMVRKGHPALRQPASVDVLRKGSYVILRPRIEGPHPIAALREWQQQRPTIALEVSEILEIFMVANRSDLFGLVPTSMEGMAKKMFDLRPLRVRPNTASSPISLYWHVNRDADPAHIFLRKELAAAAIETARQG